MRATKTRIDTEKFNTTLAYLGITRAQLAAYLKVSLPLVYAVSRGVRGLDEENIRKIERLIDEQHAKGTNQARSKKVKRL
jgi:hypothetical protein